MYILKPLRFIRDKRPTSYVKISGVDRAIVHPDYEDAIRASQRGDGATVQAIAQRVYAENQSK